MTPEQKKQGQVKKKNSQPHTDYQAGKTSENFFF